MMTKIEELIDKHSYKSSGQLGLIDLKELCKEYAEWYAMKCLKIADQNFEWDHHMELWCSDYTPSEIELPSHDEEIE